jgi:hypothetical protein
VLDVLKAKYPGEFTDPKGDSVRYAKIIIQDLFKSDDEPNQAADRIKKVVDDFLQQRKNAAEARKKATQPVVRRPSVTPQSPAAGTDSSGDSEPDYGAAVSIRQLSHTERGEPSI